MVEFLIALAIAVLIALRWLPGGRVNRPWRPSRLQRFIGWLWRRLDRPRRTAWSEFMVSRPASPYRRCACGIVHANPGPNQCTRCDQTTAERDTRVVPLRRAG